MPGIYREKRPPGYNISRLGRIGSDNLKHGAVSGRNRLSLYLFGDIVAFKTEGTDLQRYRGAVYLGFYLLEVGFPDPAGMIIGVAYRVAGNGVFSANIAGT